MYVLKLTERITAAVSSNRKRRLLYILRLCNVEKTEVNSTKYNIVLN